MDCVIEYRRALHRIPELDCVLPETTAFVQRVLEPLNCTVSSPTQGSVCAFFDAGKPETVAFRADMDALPETEVTNLPYASIHPGAMHACGHDGHTAMVLALATYVNEHLAELPHNVLLIFQPSEETTGGAKALCESGILERRRVRRIFGMHLWPELPIGTVWAKPGPQMARSSEVSIHITGNSVHISKAEQGRDALLATVRLVELATTMERAALPPDEPRVLRFGKLTCGDARNIISGHADLLGSLRSFSDTSFALLRHRLGEVCDQVSRTTGCDVKLHVSEGYSPVWNHEGLFATVCAELGEDAPHLLAQPALATEDFSFYQQYAPGLFFFLGLGNVPQLHAENFNFDDETVLPLGTAYFQKLLWLS